MKEKSKRRIAIYLYDTRKPYVGLGEMENALATRLADRAGKLKEKYGLQFCFIVPKEKKGCYGNDVEYMVFGKRHEILYKYPMLNPLAKRLFPKAELVHWCQQLPKLCETYSPHTLITVHDINFMHNGLKIREIERKKKRIRQSLDKATHLSFISHFTAADVRSNFDIRQPYRIVYNGVTDLQAVETSCDMSLPDRYLFHLSSLDSKKNPHLLVAMMRYLPDQNLVLAGKGDISELCDIVRKHKLQNVFFKGLVSTEEKAHLYARCEAFLFPSLSEGFGLPVLEAMCFGKPTFISRLTSLPEIGGEVSRYFDTLEPEAMAAVVRQGLAEYRRDEETWNERIKRHAKLFSWDKTADEYIDYYLDILRIPKSEEEEDHSFSASLTKDT